MWRRRVEREAIGKGAGGQKVSNDLEKLCEVRYEVRKDTLLTFNYDDTLFSNDIFYIIHFRANILLNMRIKSSAK